MPMLVADDDESVLEELEAEAWAERSMLFDQSVPLDPDEDEPVSSSMSREDFCVLLPLATKLLTARFEGDEACDKAFAAARVGIRRVRRLLAAMEETNRVPLEMQVWQARIKKRSMLLMKHRRKRPHLENIASGNAPV